MTKLIPPNLCWIASYPKSGNTWVRFLAAGLLRGGSITTSDIDEVIPDSHELVQKGGFDLRHQLAGRYYVKTHWMFNGTRSPFSEQNACVYILRNPMDVLASHLNFTRFPDPDLKPAYVNQFIEMGGASQWFDHGMGSWLENAKSWIAGPKRSLVLIYEDLLTFPAREIERLAGFLDVQVTADQIGNLIQQFDFTKLRDLETKERQSSSTGIFKAFSETRGGNTLFMNRGRANYFRTVMSEESAEKGMREFRKPVEQIEEMLGRSIESWSFLKES